ncbi:MAG: lysine--tRNA ligase [Acidimicrobiia bacterium]|nr:lysine--tRNA ligase [Acidimicrobiia bacterium]
MSEQRHGDRASLEADDLAGPRLAKIDAMRAAGVDPYPSGFSRTATAGALAVAHAGLGPEANTGEVVTVAGRLVGWRDIGKLVFAVLRDSSGDIQLFGDASELGDRFDEFGTLDVGDWLGVTGEVITTRKGELSVRVGDFTLLSKSLRSLPEKWHGLTDVETRHRQRYLDLIGSDEVREVFRIRSAAVRGLRQAFWDRDFVEVETPALEHQPSGAIAKPFLTHHNALDIDMYMRIALELPLKKLVVGGMERVFEMGRVFRNEGVSAKYNPEFTMLEAYQAFADYNDVMETVESVVAEAAVAARGTAALTYQGTELDLTPPWRRAGFGDLIAEHAGEGFAMGVPLEELRKNAARVGVDVDGAWDEGKILEAVFDATVERHLSQPTFVTDYPKSLSPFAKDHPELDGVVQRFEAFAGGWEIANAYSELNDPIEQRSRFEQQAALRAEGDEEAHGVNEDYLRALEYGLPPTGGLGIGVDRLIMLLADQASIREVILFPAMRPE